MADRSTALPLVSIIVPVFNGEWYLRESLDSILAQTYPRIEVLVMDDASTDGTPTIIESYGDRLKYYRQQHNRGIYENMNDGIVKAQGEYIAIYHADDVYEPTIVECEVAFMQKHPKAGAVFCQDIFIDAKGRECGSLTIPKKVRGGQPLNYLVIFNTLLRYKNCFLRCPSCMVPAFVYQDVGLYRQELFRNTSDLDMWLRIAQQYPIGILEEHLFRYRRGHGCSSQKYHHLRTDPERYFQIMDLYLEAGGRALAAPDALAAYEAHRAEDQIMRTINHYILEQPEQSRMILSQVQVSRLLRSPNVQRGRLLALFLALQVLVRLPRISFVANLFYQRWHVKGKQKPSLLQQVLSVASGVEDKQLNLANQGVRN
jgi:GT2 family glycosyltransferase